MKKFMHRLFGFSLGPVLGALISFIQVPILTYFLSVNEYGYAGTFQTLLLQLPNFIYIGIDQAYTREYHTRKDKRYLIQQAMFIPMIVGMIIFLMFILFDQTLSVYLFQNPEYRYIVWYSGIWVLSAILERFVLLSIRMEERAFEYSMYNLMLKIGVFALSLLLIATGMRDFRVIVYGLIFGQLLVDAVLFIRYADLLKIKAFKPDWPLLNRMFRFGFPLMIATALTSALNSVDIIFLNRFAPVADRGIYSVGIRIAGVVGIIKTAFSSFWVPTAYRWHEEDKSMKHYKYISDAILLILTLMFYAILLMKKPVGWLVSTQDPAYGQVQYIFALLAFPHIMYTLSETTTLGIVFSRKTRYNIWVSILTIIPSVVMNALLTPIWGYRGAALASTLAYIMFYLARTYFSSRTGFYFGQKLQLISIILMTLAAIINAFDLPLIEIYTLGLGIVTVLVQWPTLLTTLDIKRHPDDWDFN